MSILSRCKQLRQELGIRPCIKQAGYPMCSCIEADLNRGGDGRICTIPVVPAQQPLYDPWSNPFAGQGIQALTITSPSKRSFLYLNVHSCNQRGFTLLSHFKIQLLHG